VITVDALKALIGKPFPEGSFTIEDYEHWLCADAVLSPSLPQGVAHPMYGYYTAIAGMGISLDELFAMVGSSADEGPMFGEAGLEFMRPLAVGATYRVAGGITSVARKEGRRAGIFDIVAFELRLIDDDGEVAAVSTNSFVFPRRS
jgi:acyl dehydratase